MSDVAVVAVRAPRRRAWRMVVAAAVATALAVPPRPALATPRSHGAFGVRWRLRLDAAHRPVWTWQRRPIAIGDAIFVLEGGAVVQLDAATGARRAAASFPDGFLFAAGDLLVLRTGRELIALEPATLTVRWRDVAPPAHLAVIAAGPWLLEGGSGAISARRVADGGRAWSTAMWGNLRAAIDDGGDLYVATYGDVYALDGVTGVLRWKATGNLAGAAGGRVIVHEYQQPIRVLRADGSEERRLPAGWVHLAGDTAYHVSDDGLRAFDLADGRELWHQPRKLPVVAADDTRLYASDQDPGGPALLAILDRATGELLERIVVADGEGDAPAPAWTGDPTTPLVVAFDAGWLLAFGERGAPERPRRRVVHGRVRIRGCGAPWPLAGARVTIAGASATTDRAGRFRLRVPVTRAITPILVDTDHELDDDFPTAAILDAGPLDLTAGWIGAGCHDE